MTRLTQLIVDLEKVRTLLEFKNWVRFELREVLPHAAFLGTFGKLYAIGSVPTHRVEVDFPLGIIEELKNSDGSLEDPVMHVWFRNGRARFVDIQDFLYEGSALEWRRLLGSFGMRSMLIHGVLDHKARRFSVFQITNPLRGEAAESARLFGALVDPMARVMWSVISTRQKLDGRRLAGSPTLSLTATELQIVQMLSQGLSNKEIARRRGVSDSTVKTQVQRTGAKLGATRRAEIVAVAMPLLSQLPPQSVIDYDDDRFGYGLRS